MRPNTKVTCEGLACSDVRHDLLMIPSINIKPTDVSLILISEAAPPDPADYYFAGGEALFEQTTLQAFQDAGIPASSIKELVGRGVYFTTAVKCGKTGYGIATPTVKNCSYLLEKELALFPNVNAYLLMGDVAIKAVNEIARRNGQPRVIPAGSTYKLRGREYFFQGKRAFPSYLQAGPSFFIEKTKRKAIAEDIAAAFKIVSA